MRIPDFILDPTLRETLSRYETPEVLLSGDILGQRIQTMGRLARQHGQELWPHVKTHKSLAIAQMQLEAGASGLTAAKSEEAAVFLNAGLGPVILAYPTLDAAKLDRVLESADTGRTRVLFIVDSADGASSLALAAQRHNRDLEVYIKVDVGLGRCGLEADDPELLTLARHLSHTLAGASKSPGLRLAGLLSHAGHAYAAGAPHDVREIAEQERLLMLRARDLVAGSLEISPDSLRLSVGSTPTVLACPDFTGLHSIRPGNYVFLDRSVTRLGLATPRDVSLWVLARVVSKNRNFLIIDAGAKTLALDRAPHGMGGEDYGHGLAWPLSCPDIPPLPVARLSEEHGLVSRNLHPDLDLPVGALMAILPNHACPVANLAERYLVHHQDKGLSFWNVDARAKVR